MPNIVDWGAMGGLPAVAEVTIRHEKARAGKLPMAPTKEGCPALGFVEEGQKNLTA